MIPILFEKTENAFLTNGICRLRDAISAVVTEERNGIYELNLQYPVDGANFDLIQCGRIIGVRHDDTNDIQPFDIVSYSRPIDGVVTFHCVHISYRQNGLTVSGTNINSLADALTLLGNATPSNPFTYETDITSSAYMAAADGIPRTVRQMLGGVEGSILDAYGGEYEWDKFKVILHANRGETKDFTIRYGLNMTDYDEETDYQGTYTSVIPYWTSGDVTVKGSKVNSGLVSYNGREICIPLDLSEKFETKPTAAQLKTKAQSMISQANLPNQNIKVDFVRLQDLGEYEQFESLLQCKLCDSIKVVFPRYGMTGTFKIVKTVYDVLLERFEEMELGALQVTLAEALGISNSPEKESIVGSIEDYVVEESINHSAGQWSWRKWASGVSECWGKFIDSTAMSNSSVGGYASTGITPSFPAGLFVTTIPQVNCNIYAGTIVCWPVATASPTVTDAGTWKAFRLTSSTSTADKVFNFLATGRWM